MQIFCYQVNRKNSKIFWKLAGNQKNGGSYTPGLPFYKHQHRNSIVTKALSVILKKVPGKISITKLQAILLLEADFNALHKIIFN